MQADVQGFACGDEIWAAKMAEWISGTKSLESMARGTEIWIFRNETREVVGFGAIGLTSWPWPGPGQPPEQVCIIPAMAVQTSFQKRGYSRRILRFLIRRALNYLRFALVLYVHPENSKAIALYESEGFAMLPDKFKGNCKMALILEPSTPPNQQD